MKKNINLNSKRIINLIYYLAVYIFSLFYLTTIKHIQNTLQKGWEKKDSINWNNYKI